MRPTPVTTPSAGRSPASALASRRPRRTSRRRAAARAGRGRTACSARASFSPSLARLPCSARSVCSRIAIGVAHDAYRPRSRRRRAAARSAAPGRRCPARAPRTRAARRGRCRCRCPCRRSMCTRSSVTALPDAPGAYGQPPRPPIDASKRVTPRSSAATTLASAVPRVLWKCSPIRSVAIAGRSSASSRSSTRRGRGHPGGVAERQPVGARVDEMAGELRHPLGRDVAFVRDSRTRSTRSPRPRSRPRARSRRRRARRPATRRPSAARSSGCASRSRSPRARSRRRRRRPRARHPWRWARARSRRRPARERCRPSRRSAPAIGGIAAGETNDAASIAPQPGAGRASISRMRAATGTGVFVLQAVARSDLSDLDARGPGRHADRLRCEAPNAQSFRRRTRSLIGVGPRSNDSRSLRSRYRRYCGGSARVANNVKVGRVGRALRRVENPRPVPLHDRRRMGGLRVAQHAVERGGRDALVVRRSRPPAARAAAGARAGR